MEPSHQTSGFSQFLPALWLFCSPIYCCPPGVRSKPSSTQAGTVSAPSPGNVGWAQGALRSLKLWRTIFQGLLELLRFGWDQGGEMTKLICFQRPTCLCAWRSIAAGTAGSAVMLTLSLRHPHSGCFSLPEKGTSTEKQKTAN